MPITDTDIDDYRNALSDLHDQLNQAYWYASTIEAKDALNGLSQAVADILTEVNVEALDENTDKYKPLKEKIDAVNKKLKSVKAQIDGWVHAISIATEVVKIIDQALAQCAKLYPI